MGYPKRREEVKKFKSVRVGNRKTHPPKTREGHPAENPRGWLEAGAPDKAR
jgi:hypothetical protein